jgi:hypothetical protein
LVENITQQVRATAGSSNQTSQKVKQASVEVGGETAKVVRVSNKQRDEEIKVRNKKYNSARYQQ